MSRRTVLYPYHVALGARMVDFAGWEMPVRYGSIIEEHLACRKRAAVFDICHMGEIEILASDVRAALNSVLSNDFSQVPDGAARYGLIMNEQGGIIDDTITLLFGSSKAVVVTNAANTDRDFEWIRRKLPPGSTAVNRSAELGKIDIQGPRSRDVMTRILGRDLTGLKHFRFIETSWRGTSIVLSRTGYTGELGYEVFLEAGRAGDFWSAVLEEEAADGVTPAGLGARDTLRLEAALPLYGHELDEKATPAEAGLMKYVALRKREDFPGKRALEALGEPARNLVGIEMVERGIPRNGYEVLQRGEKVGVVTSGTMSPSLHKGIAMAYVDSDATKTGTQLEIMVRNRAVPCTVVDMPFYRKGRVT